jgi:peptidoglycan hydrolase-like protein with peptidoglycan-binding domain
LCNERMTGGKATGVARWATTTLMTTLGIAALSVAIATAPAEAKKQKAPADTGIADADNGEPLFLVISTGAQKVDVYRGTTLVTSSQVSTGMPAHPTFLGAFSILEKQRWHHSNIYSGAPMPWMNRITWSGTALHAGVVPGYPASHGCIRLPYSFAPKLYSITSVGDNVVISRDRPAPALIEHSNLFQPLPPPPPPTLVKSDQPKEHQSNNDLLILPSTSVLPRPVVLAKAEVGSVTTDVSADDLGIDDNSHATVAPKGGATANVAPAPAASTAEAAEVKSAQTASTGAGTVEDTHTHAIDPAPAGGTASHAVLARGERIPAKAIHALGSDDDSEAPKSVAAAPAAETSSPAPATPAAATPAPVEAAAATATPTTPKPAVMSAATTDIPAVVTTPAAAPAPAQKAVAETPLAPAAPAPAPEAVAAAAPVDPAPAASRTPVDPAPAAAPTPVAAAGPSAAPAETPSAEATPAAPPAEAAKVAPAPVQVAVAAPAVDAPPSVVETKLDGGTQAAAIQAAEPRSTAPLRILVTRRTQRDRIIGVQRILSDLGYLEPQDFDGTLGKATATAIKAFQKANGMPESGAFTDDLVKKVYEVAGKGEPPVGHIFVRQEFSRVFDAPVGLTNPDEPLGTHVYTVMNFAPGATKARWMAVTVQGGSPEEALDRIQIPDDIRQRISERLTPGSTLIIGDTSINSATLPKGGDFVVLAKYSSPKTAANSASSGGDDQSVKRKKARVRRNIFNYNYGYNVQRGFRASPGWPW